IVTKDITPFVYLAEIYLLENNLEKEEKCIEKYNLQSAVYLTEYGSALQTYPVFAEILKEDFGRAVQILLANRIEGAKNGNIYCISLNFETTFFMGRKPLEDFEYNIGVLEKDPDYWFWRITNEHFIQKTPFEVSMKEASKEALLEEDYSQFLEKIADGNEPSIELLSKIKERSNREIEYKFYYQACLLYCAEYYDNKGDKEKAKRFAREILANKPIGYVKKCAQQIVSR
ncbi:MAG: hypothetical protein N2445_04345, partial [Acidobacteria bacterium]|nr:hypothetical protein [Acidobacteriota bacterium]